MKRAVFALLLGCGASQPALTDAQVFACNQKGLQIIAAEPTCESTVAALRELVRKSPECREVFRDDIVGISCEQEGGSDGSR